MSTCNHCSTVFPSYEHLRVHRRSCDPKVTVRFPNGIFQVVRRPDGFFYCQCAAPKCARSFATTQGIRNHASKSEFDWLDKPPGLTAPSTVPQPNPGGAVNPTTHDGDEDPEDEVQGPASGDEDRLPSSQASSPTASSRESDEEDVMSVDEPQDPHEASHFIDFPAIRTIGCVVESRTRLLYCLKCKIMLPYTWLPDHWSQKHKGLGIHPKPNQFFSLGKEYKLAKELPELWLSLEPIPSLKGLPVVSDCVRCPHCRHVYLASSLASHCSRQHPGLPVPTSLPRIKAQRLSNGTKNRLFEVTEPSDSDDSSVVDLTPLEKMFSEQRAERTASLRSTHVDPYNVDDLIRLAALPSKQENSDRITDSVIGLFRFAYDLIPGAPPLVLEMLNTPNPINTGTLNSPLKQHFTAGSFDNYVRPMVRLVWFLLRDKKEKYTLPLSNEIEACLDMLRNPHPDPEKDEKNLVLALQSIFLHLWTHCWSKRDGNSIGDPTVAYLALSTLKPDGSFKEPTLVTPVIAQIEYCIRLFFLYLIHVKGKGEPERMTEVAKRYRLYYTEKQQSTTFNEIRALQHRASAYAYAEDGSIKIVWTDRKNFRTMLYKGDPIHLDNLTPMFDAMHSDAISRWEDHLLMGLDLRVDYQDLADDLSNNAVGYSFIHDRRNKVFADRDRLVRAICADRKLSEHFLTGTIVDGKPMWNIHALQRWLKHYADFHLLLLACLETMGGSPGRGTEVCCLEYRNTRTRPQRGLYMVGNHLTVVCRYHKGSSMTGFDKVLPHSLDAVTSDLLIQDLAIARPFAELAANICFPNNPDVLRLYDTHLFVNINSAFTTEHLSDTLRLYTLKYLGVSTGTRDWRHFTSGYRHKICPGYEEEKDREKEGIESLAALQAGHTRSTEMRLYGVSDSTVRGIAEDVMPNFLDKSTEWQVVVRVVPGGSLLPYREARVEHFDALAAAGRIKSIYLPASGMPYLTTRTTPSLQHPVFSRVFNTSVFDIIRIRIHIKSSRHSISF
ncbi:helicase domain-containing protein [Coprinopsis cinerea AmutBmut pab1-1]|nr:helicase domain-containing protein [Coprinopsis cinerea AmutBmut pab1-1]